MQVKQTQVIRLANIMGMDIDNKQHQLALHDSVTSVSSPDDFVEYCREKQNGIDYANRLDKLEVLFTRYKNTIDDIPVSLLENFCKELTQKFKEAIQILRDHEEHLSKDLSKFTNHREQYFTNKEIELMDAVGGLNRLIGLYELNALYDTLYEKSVQKTIAAKKYNALTSGQKKVMHLLDEARKG